jgi:hypothetical protein
LTKPSEIKKFVPQVTSLPVYPTYIDFIKTWDNFAEDTTMWDNLKNNRGLALPKPIPAERDISFQFQEKNDQIFVEIKEPNPSGDLVPKEIGPLQFCQDAKGNFSIKGPQSFELKIVRKLPGFYFEYKGKKLYTNERNPTRPETQGSSPSSSAPARQ